MKLRALTVLSVVTSSVALLLGAGRAEAAACSLTEQVTSSAVGSAVATPALDADGDRVAFLSKLDLTGGNADGNNEIFLFDLDTDTFTQITSTTGGGAGNSGPSISDDGTRVVFFSGADLTGGNADLSDEVFLYDSTGPTLTQVSSVAEEFEAVQPDISGDGTDIAFKSDADLTGGNPDGNEEIFLVNATGSPSFTQVTSSTTGNSRSPSMNDSGTRVAFLSTSDLVPGTGNADGNAEVFVRDAVGPTTSQLTATADPGAGVGALELSEDGSRVVFSTASDLTGGNPEGNLETFRRTIASSTFVQLTDTTTGLNADPSVDQTGSRVVYLGNGTDQPRNPDGGSETLVTDGGPSDPTAMTVSTSISGSIYREISDDGLTVAVIARNNPLGTNPDGNDELFLGRCGPLAPTFTDVPKSNVFYGQVQWMEELGIASGFPGGLFKPQDAVKRQQMANFMYNLAGQPAFTPPLTPTFSDVPASNPFFLQIEWMVAEGIASGFPGGLFKPQDPVKRQQMANFMYNLAGQPLFSAPGSPTFGDVPLSNPFFLEVEWMAAEGIASGFPGGLFKPQDPVKRQQMANFMHAFAVSPGVSLPE